MNASLKKPSFFSLLFLSAIATLAQVTPSTYEPHELFTEKFKPPAGTAYRSANGTPGPAYWQNSADYLIHATLTEKDTVITGDVSIEYTNNSPNALEYLWLAIDQNVFTPGSKGIQATPLNSDIFGYIEKNKGGYNLSQVTVTHLGKSYAVTPIVSDTRMQIRLATPLEANGGKITLSMNYAFKIPIDGLGRFGIISSKTGPVYQVAQWFPRMCVYDDVQGWNTLPYLGFGEFYCDYGNMEFYVTAPASLIIYGSGDLQNASEVLTPTQIKRLETAAKSEKTVSIVGFEELGTASIRPTTKGTLTWHFSMKNTRDVAFAAGKGMIWDAANVNLPSGRKVLAMSAYPPESMGQGAWSRSTEYLKQAIEIYSRDFYEYPWNTAISIAGATTGMEYPGIIFNDYREVGASLWFLVSHEIGHNWYPMIVGSNERKYMWQDEGLNTYINYLANEHFNKGEYNNDPLYAQKDFWATLDYEVFSDNKDPLMTLSDAMDIDEHFQFYTKTAYGLNLLRNVIVGKERFDYAFRKYTEAWAFKHPTPYDFFRCINNATGEDLNWFWNEWFFTAWTLDQAIGSVTYVDNSHSKGAVITIINKGQLTLPVIVRVKQSNGKESTVQLPIEVWQRESTWSFSFPSTSKIKQVTLDPEGILPDVDRSNNIWKE